MGTPQSWARPPGTAALSPQSGQGPVTLAPPASWDMRDDALGTQTTEAGAGGRTGSFKVSPQRAGPLLSWLTAWPLTPQPSHEAAGDCGPRQEADVLERLQRAWRRAAEPLEAGAAGRQAGQELDGRVQVRLRCVPSRRRSVRARFPRVIPLLVAAPLGKRGDAAGPLGRERGSAAPRPPPRTPVLELGADPVLRAHPSPLHAPPRPLRAPRPPPVHFAPSTRPRPSMRPSSSAPTPSRDPFIRSPASPAWRRPWAPWLFSRHRRPAGRSRKVQRTRSGKVQPCQGAGLQGPTPGCES